MSTEADREQFLTSARGLPQLVLPLYTYAESVRPDAVFICDRDARPIGTAIDAIRQKTGGLASIGEHWYYRRISGRIGQSALTQHLAEPLLAIKRDATKKPLIVVVDDYVSGKASTCSSFREVCTDLGVDADIRWTTLSGRGTAFNAHPFAGASSLAPWRDRPEVLGIDYEGIELVEKPTQLSIAFNEAIQHAVSQLEI